MGDTRGRGGVIEGNLWGSRGVARGKSWGTRGEGHVLPVIRQRYLERWGRLNEPAARFRAAGATSARLPRASIGPSKRTNSKGDFYSG